MRNLALYLLLATLLVIEKRATEPVNYDDPVQTSAEDEIQSLPGLDEAITFRQYSGYLKADRNGKDFLHYWFVEATENPASKPILLWLNGGPGCSSMEGLFSELGPFVLKDGHVKLRKYSWNKLANVLFLESPIKVGYSYTKRLIGSITDDTTALGNYIALKSFFDKFPQYKQNPLFLSGESYAGVYLPTLGVLIDADKSINLKGIAIGNGYLDAQKLGESLVYFMYYHGLLGKTFWEDLKHKCCNGLPPARGNCKFRGEYCYGHVRTQVEKVMSLPGFNAYNIYGDCPKPRGKISSNVTRWSIDSKLRQVLIERTSSDQSRPFEVLGLDTVAVEPPCFDGEDMVKYMNDPKVRDVIHIPKTLGEWNECTNLNYVVKYPIRPGGLAPQINKLINSDRKLALLVYNGDTDLVCNALGDEWFVDDLERRVVADWRAWKTDQQIAGFVKHYDGIVYATVRGAGHMVPEYRPKEAFSMISVFLNSTNHKMYL